MITMQSGRTGSPLRNIIQGTSFSIQAPLLNGHSRQNLTATNNNNNSTTARGGLLIAPQHIQQHSMAFNSTPTSLSHANGAYNLTVPGTSQVTILKRNSHEAGLLAPSGDDTSDTEDERPKPTLKPGKKTKGRVKIKMEFIENKLRRYTTFSKRKTGIMKKAYELSTLTGTQVMLLVASETGHVYTFATRKLQPMITSDSGKALIQTCLNSPDPPPMAPGQSVDQRMNPTGYEEPELTYAVSEEETKDVIYGTSHSPLSEEEIVVNVPIQMTNYAHRPPPQQQQQLPAHHQPSQRTTSGQAPAHSRTTISQRQTQSQHHRQHSAQQRTQTSNQNPAHSQSTINANSSRASPPYGRVQISASAVLLPSNGNTANGTLVQSASANQNHQQQKTVSAISGPSQQQTLIRIQAPIIQGKNQLINDTGQRSANSSTPSTQGGITIVSGQQYENAISLGNTMLSGAMMYHTPQGLVYAVPTSTSGGTTLTSLSESGYTIIQAPAAATIAQDQQNGLAQSFVTIPVSVNNAPFQPILTSQPRHVTDSFVGASKRSDRNRRK